MKRLLLFYVAVFCGILSRAQLLTWSPAFPKDNDPITITVDASKGNQGLFGYTGNVYVHIGAITSQSSGPGQWQHVSFTWGSTEAAALATPAGANKWSFTINNPRTFFNLGAGEQLRQIAILFRRGGCSDNCSAQRNADESDMFVPIYDGSFAVRIDQPARQPKYQPEPEPQAWTVGSGFTLTARSSLPATITLYHNNTLLATQANVQALSAQSTVLAEGNQQLVAVASDGTTTRTDTMNIFVSPAASPVVALPAGVRDGINYEPGDTSVTLVLRAPGKDLVGVTGDFNNWTPDLKYIMNKTPDGKFFWLRIHPLTPGVEYAYQYRVDNSLKIADPYTEKILDPARDPEIPSATYPNLRPYPAGQKGIVSLLQTAAPMYNWSAASFGRPDKRGLVIYELLVRDFVAAHDWKTIRDSLNYFKRLGINAIELMPVNEFEANDSWGYNPDFYFAPDKYYGPKNTFKEFIDSCHSKGIAVIMDIALNHSFGSSPMVQLYWDAANSRPAANNPWFNPVPRHAFNVGYDMNHESADTKYFFGRVVEHWLQQYRIDGFRFDLSKGFTQKATCDANGANCDVAAMGAYDASRVAIWKGYYDTVQNKSAGSYAILEHFAANQEEKELADYGMLLWGNMSTNYQEAAMGYLGNTDLGYGIYSAPVRGWTRPHLVSYMESHDEERIVFKNISFGNGTAGYQVKDTATALRRMELDAAFLFSIPGPKMLWQFGELGYDYSITSCHPGNTIPQPYPSDNCRLSAKPVRWDYASEPRRQAVFSTYSKLIKLRFHPWYRDAFISGQVSQDVGNNVAVKWITVTTDTSRLLVIGNFDVTTRSGTVTFPASGVWYDYLNNQVFNASGAGQNISLQPGEFHVYLNRDVNNTLATPVVNVPGNGNALEARIYPNPALSDFTMELQLPVGRKVTIDLYNSLGQYLATLYHGFLGRGTHELPLKKDKAAGGTCYVRISAGNTTETVKLTFQ